jgi:hypothetical protein
MKRENSLRNMYTAVINEIIYYVAVWTGYLPFETCKSDFDAKLQKIDETEELRNTLLKGFAKTKKAKKKQMSLLANAVCRKVRAYAIDTGNTGLFGQMQISMSKLLYSNSQLSKDFAEQIYAAADGLTAGEKTAYALDGTVLTDFRVALDAYITYITMPRDKIVARMQAVDLLKELYPQASAILKDRLDNLMSNYQESNPEFYARYFNARIIQDNIRHATIEGTVVDEETGADLKNVKVTFSSGTESFQEMTDVQGAFERQELNPELEWDVKFELPGYEEQQISEVELNRGEHEKFNVKLKKITP